MACRRDRFCGSRLVSTSACGVGCHPQTRAAAHCGGHAAHSLGESHTEDDQGLSLLTNGHHHEIVQQPLDSETRLALNAQVDETREVARLYPTVADADAAGYRRAGPYSPGLGAHYIKY